MLEDLVYTRNRDLKGRRDAFKRFAALISFDDGVVALSEGDIRRPRIIRHGSVVIERHNKALNRRFSQKYSSVSKAPWGHSWIFYRT